MTENDGRLIRAAVITLSDRGSRGERADESGPIIERFIADVGGTVVSTEVIPDEAEILKNRPTAIADSGAASFVLSSGGTGLAPRDVTPEATLAVADRVLDGFGEQMRAVSLKYVPTAILSRQVGVIRKQSLILNLPGQPKAIKETLDGVFAAVPYCIDLIGGPYLETLPEAVQPFRPKSAQRPKPENA